MDKLTEERIAATKCFIKDLSKLQDIYFANLMRKMNPTIQAEEFLFDYIFNSENDTFEEYLKEHGYDSSIY